MLSLVLVNFFVPVTFVLGLSSYNVPGLVLIQFCSFDLITKAVNYYRGFCFMQSSETERRFLVLSGCSIFRTMKVRNAGLER